MDLLRQTPDKYYCLACVDPPYGLGRKLAHSANTNKNSLAKFSKKVHTDKWDYSIPSSKYFTELIRVSKNYIIWGANHYTTHLPPSRCFIAWDKMVFIPSMSRVEMALTSFDLLPRLIQINNNDSGRIHPTQKPVALYDWIYKNYLPQGGKVIDTHLGSGSNRIAANRAGNIDFVGFELDRDYYEAQEKRWKGFISQTRLF